MGELSLVGGWWRDQHWQSGTEDRPGRSVRVLRRLSRVPHPPH